MVEVRVGRALDWSAVFDSVGCHPFSYKDSDIKYPMNDVASSTSNLLSLLLLTNTDTTWSFCGCDKRSIHSFVQHLQSTKCTYIL